MGFLQMEAMLDIENKEMLIGLDLTHLKTNKKTGKLTIDSRNRIKAFDKYPKESKALMKKYETTHKMKYSYERFGLFEKEKTWIRN